MFLEIDILKESDLSNKLMLFTPGSFNTERCPFILNKELLLSQD